MTIAAVPTAYAGVNFRSRLEARWAVMFDLLGWEWEYEPADLAGYIPDFRLPSHIMSEKALGNFLGGWKSVAIKNFFVEIKPVTTASDFSTAIAKAVQAVADTDDTDADVPPVTRFLFLGDRPWLDYEALGLFMDVTHGDREAANDVDAVYLLPNKRIISGCKAVLCEEYDVCKDCCVTDCVACSKARRALLLALWREAGNRTQWRAALRR